MRIIEGRNPICLEGFKRIKTQRHHNRVPVETDAYVLLGTHKKGEEERQTATLSLSHQVGSWCAAYLGEKVCVHINLGDRLLLITADDGKGDERTISNTGRHNARMSISLSGMHDELKRRFGDHRKVHFEAEVYGNMVLLRPTGEVE